MTLQHPLCVYVSHERRVAQPVLPSPSPECLNDWRRIERTRVDDSERKGSDVTACD